MDNVVHLSTVVNPSYALGVGLILVVISAFVGLLSDGDVVGGFISGVFGLVGGCALLLSCGTSPCVVSQHEVTNTVADAHDVKRVLQHQGFTVRDGFPDLDVSTLTYHGTVYHGCTLAYSVVSDDQGKIDSVGCKGFYHRLP